jgi:hypothetical protein
MENSVEDSKCFENPDNSFDPHIALRADYEDIPETEIKYEEDIRMSDEEGLKVLIKEPPQQRSRADAYANMRPKKCYM